MPSSGRLSVLGVVLPVVLLTVITCLAYANAWPNALLVDDKLFVDYEAVSDFSAIPQHFGEDAWVARGLSGGLYRPMLFASIALDTNLFRDWVAGYHLVNVLLHVVLTLLVYAFLARPGSWKDSPCSCLGQSTPNARNQSRHSVPRS